MFSVQLSPTRAPSTPRRADLLPLPAAAEVPAQLHPCSFERSTGAWEANETWRSPLVSPPLVAFSSGSSSLNSLSPVFLRSPASSYISPPVLPARRDAQALRDVVLSGRDMLVGHLRQWLRSFADTWPARQDAHYLLRLCDATTDALAQLEAQQNFAPRSLAGDSAHAPAPRIAAAPILVQQRRLRLLHRQASMPQHSALGLAVPAAPRTGGQTAAVYACFDIPAAELQRSMQVALQHLQALRGRSTPERRAPLPLEDLQSAMGACRALYVELAFYLDSHSLT